MEKFELIEITPAIAREWLDTKNRNNRTIDFKRVKEYARQMSTSDWDITGQAISFDTDGVLIDGQHRLAAVCLANKPVKMLVATGLRRSLNYDNGRLRSPSDAVYMATGIKLGNNIMATAALACRVREGNWAGRKICVDEQYKWVMKHKEALDAISTIHGTKKIIGTASIVLAMVSAYENGVSLPTLEGWAKVVADGIYELPYQQTAVRYRNWWFNHISSSRNRSSSYDALKAAQLNIKKYANKETVKQIAVPDGLTYQVK